MLQMNINTVYLIKLHNCTLALLIYSSMCMSFVQNKNYFIIYCSTLHEFLEILNVLSFLFFCTRKKTKTQEILEGSVFIYGFVHVDK